MLPGDALKWNIKECVNQILIWSHFANLFNRKYKIKLSKCLGLVNSQANVCILFGISQTNCVKNFTKLPHQTLSFESWAETLIQISKLIGRFITRGEQALFNLSWKL